MSHDIPLKPCTIVLLGLLAVVGGFLAVLADVYSAFVPDQQMETAFAVGYGDVIDLLRAKSPDDHLTGSLLGQYFIPFHIFGWVLMYFALRPAGKKIAALVAMMASYTTIVGASLHASLVWAGAVARDNNPGTIAEVAPFFNITAYSMVSAILLFSVIIGVLILSGKTLYPRLTVLLSPIGYMAITTISISTIPALKGPVSSFITAAGFNLPSAIFNFTTMVLLLRHARSAG